MRRRRCRNGPRSIASPGSDTPRHTAPGARTADVVPQRPGETALDVLEQTFPTTKIVWRGPHEFACGWFDIPCTRVVQLGEVGAHVVSSRPRQPPSPNPPRAAAAVRGRNPPGRPICRALWRRDAVRAARSRRRRVRSLVHCNHARTTRRRRADLPMKRDQSVGACRDRCAAREPRTPRA